MILQSFAVAWLIGAGLVACGLPVWSGLSAALLVVPFHRHLSVVARVGLALLFASVSAGGGRWYQSHSPAASLSDVSHFIGDGPTRVRGVVEGDRDSREHALLLRLRVLSVEDDRGWHAASGLLLLRMSPSARYEDGDLLEARGKPSPPPTATSFDYRAYLSRQGIFAEMDYPSIRLLAQDTGPRWRHLLVKLRERLADGVSSVLPEPEASLGAGIALGTRRVIEPTLNVALTATGTAQIIVASGYNITIVSAFTLGALGWLVGRRWALWLTLAGIWTYALFVGLYPSIVRAAIMGMIVVLAGVAGRPHSGMRALVIAAAVLVAISPLPLFVETFGSGPLPLNDLSFLLSLFGTAGLFLFAEPLGSVFRNCLRIFMPGRDVDGRPGLIVEGPATTLAAMAGSLPVILAAFHTFSLSALPANLVLFPLVPAIMAASGAVAVAGALWHPAALLLAPLAYSLLGFMVLVVRLFAQLPGSQIQIAWFGLPEAVAVYLVLFAPFAVRGWRWPGTITTPIRELVASCWERFLRGWQSVVARRSRPSRTIPSAGWIARPPVVAGLAMMFGLAICFPLIGARGRPPLRATYLDVGAGSAILLQAGSERVLIDGGPPGDATVRALDGVLAPWDRSLNLVIVTSRAAAHVGGLPGVLRRYRVGLIVDATREPQTTGKPDQAWRDWHDVASERRVSVTSTTKLLKVNLGESTLSLSPLGSIVELRDSSVPTVEVTLADRSILLTGDPTGSHFADVRSISASLETVPRSLARAQILEASSVAGSASTLAKLPAAFRAVPIYRTTENGNIVIDVRRADLTVSTQRGPSRGILGGN